PSPCPSQSRQTAVSAIAHTPFRRRRSHTGRGSTEPGTPRAWVVCRTPTRPGRSDGAGRVRGLVPRGGRSAACHGWGRLRRGRLHRAGLLRAWNVIVVWRPQRRRTGNAFAHDPRRPDPRGTSTRPRPTAATRCASPRPPAAGPGGRGALMALAWALTGRGAYDEIDDLLATHGLTHEAGSSAPVRGTCWSPAATCGVARRGSPRRATTRGARRRSSGRRTRST